MRVTERTPGSSAGGYESRPVDFLYQSRMRPTNGETSCTPASAQATAWAKEKRRVKLQWIPSRVSCRAAQMPSHVEASLIKMRPREMPACSYRLISERALAMELWTSKL